MMKIHHIIYFAAYIITAVTVMSGILEIMHATETYIELKQHVSDDRFTVCINYIPDNSPSYTTNIEIGDTVIGADNIPVSSIYQMKTEVFYKKHANDIVILQIRNNGKIKHIPVLLRPRKSMWEMLFLIFFSFASMTILLFFYITFKGEKRYALDMSICYFLITIAYVFSYVSFEKPLLYVFLIMSASFSPAIPIYIGIKLLMRTKRIFLRIIPFIVSLVICIIWLYAYIRLSINYTAQHHQQLSMIIQLTQLLIGLMSIAAIIFIVSISIKHIRENYEVYVPIALLAIIAGYIPYLMLYALPVALGKHEIISVDLTLIFTLIPLLGIVIYNNFIYENYL